MVIVGDLQNENQQSSMVCACVFDIVVKYIQLHIVSYSRWVFMISILSVTSVIEANNIWASSILHGGYKPIDRLGILSMDDLQYYKSTG